MRGFSLLLVAQVVSPALAFGVLLTLLGLASLAVGYALLRGERGQSGGLGPFSERFIHAAAGLRMILGGGALSGPPRPLGLLLGMSATLGSLEERFAALLRPADGLPRGAP